MMKGKGEFASFHLLSTQCGPPLRRTERLWYAYLFGSSPRFWKKLACQSQEAPASLLALGFVALRRIRLQLLKDQALQPPLEPSRPFGPAQAVTANSIAPANSGPQPRFQAECSVEAEEPL
jgi:hypothetical protein